jgi:hypothetical protein
MWLPRGSLQQLTGFDTQDGRQTVNNIDACIVNATLQGTDVGAIDIRAMRELLLGQAFSLPRSSQISRKYLSNLHDPENSGLMTILPRSILYSSSDGRSCSADYCGGAQQL